MEAHQTVTSKNLHLTENTQPVYCPHLIEKELKKSKILHTGTYIQLGKNMCTDKKVYLTVSSYCEGTINALNIEQVWLSMPQNAERRCPKCEHGH